MTPTGLAADGSSDADSPRVVIDRSDPAARSAGVLAAGAAPLTALVLLALVELLVTPPVVTTAPLGVRLRGEGVPLTRLLGAVATLQFARAVLGERRGGGGR